MDVYHVVLHHFFIVLQCVPSGWISSQFTSPKSSSRTAMKRDDSPQCPVKKEGPLWFSISSGVNFQAMGRWSVTEPRGPAFMTMAFSSTGSNIGSISFSTFSMTKHLGSSFFQMEFTHNHVFWTLFWHYKHWMFINSNHLQKEWIFDGFWPTKMGVKNHALRAFYGYTGAQWVFTCFHQQDFGE